MRKVVQISPEAYAELCAALEKLRKVCESAQKVEVDENRLHDHITALIAKWRSWPKYRGAGAIRYWHRHALADELEAVLKGRG